MDMRVKGKYVLQAGVKVFLIMQKISLSRI